MKGGQRIEDFSREGLDVYQETHYGNMHNAEK